MLLVFDVVGTVAHFRRFDTNSSSLTYHVPPRTAVAGMLGAVLGLSFAEVPAVFSTSRCRIGVALKVPVRTITTTVNYLNTKKGVEDWHGHRFRTQVPVEWVLPAKGDVLRYGVFLVHEDDHLVRELYALTSQNRSRYPVYLGTAQCCAWVENAVLYDGSDLEWSDCETEVVPVLSVVPLNRVLRVEAVPGTRVASDRVPVELTPDRRLVSATDVAWNPAGEPLWLQLRGDRFRPPGSDVWHVFVEP